MRDEYTDFEEDDEDDADILDRLSDTFEHHRSVLRGKLALKEVTEDDYNLFMSYLDEYDKVIDG